MKLNKGVNVTKRDIRRNQLYRDCHLYTSRVYDDSPRFSYGNARDIGIQYNYKKDNVLCTCKNDLKGNPEVSRYFNGKHIFTYHASRSFTDVGVGTVTASQRRKIKRIHLPETDARGVGSSDLSCFWNRRTRYFRESSYDERKRTTSKCVGGFITTTAAVLSEKLSPIIQTKSGSTSPKLPSGFVLKNDTEVGNNTNDDMATAQVIDDKLKGGVNIDNRAMAGNVKYESLKEDAQGKKHSETDAVPYERELRVTSKRAQEAERVFSSDSLLQHVHNLETPSGVQESPLSIDPMENKLEREYRKMFTMNPQYSKDNKTEEDKTESSLKSTSILRKRFEALRRGITKKEDSKRNSVMNKTPSKVSQISRRDVSIVSDPPSLEGRSYSNNKIYTAYSKVATNSKDVYKTYESEKVWGPDYEVADNEGVKGMFKLWGKRFNLEEDDVANSPKWSVEQPQQPRQDKELRILSRDSISKPDGRKLFFFKRKSKDKTKPACKQKKGVTAGRCEVGDGLTIKIGAANASPHHPAERERAMAPIHEEYGGMLRKAWLQQFLTRSFESRHSVKIRWNNKSYGTSSSTVFEIMENVYKDSGVVFRSTSDVTTTESSCYKSFTKHRVNFVRDIEAWMIPKLITDNIQTRHGSSHNQDLKDISNIEVTISNQKWFIDKSKAFAHKIDVVLHSLNVLKFPFGSSSEYLTIDIPKGFFSDLSSDSFGPIYTSNEEVYKVVEYESPESYTRLDNNKKETGDRKDVKVTVSVKSRDNLESKTLEKVIKARRDVVIQGSDVCIPKRFDVIGVGIITQRDINGNRKPISKMQDQYLDDDSALSTQMPDIKCKFANSYVRDYYRQWVPLNLGCASESQLEACTENQQIKVNNETDGIKSFPIYDDYQTSLIPSCVTSCCNSSTSKDDKHSIVTKLYNRLKSMSKSETVCTGKRVSPKDSVEVFKRRKIYAQSNKSNWLTDDGGTYSMPSVDSNNTNCSKSSKKAKTKEKTSKKHVSLFDCDEFPDKVEKHSKISSPQDISNCSKDCQGLLRPLLTSLKNSHSSLPPCISSQSQGKRFSPCTRSLSGKNVTPRMPPCKRLQSQPSNKEQSSSTPLQSRPMSPRSLRQSSPTNVFKNGCKKNSPCYKCGALNSSSNLPSSPPSVPLTCNPPKKGACSSPGKPLCGSPPVSGINLRSSSKPSPSSLPRETFLNSLPPCAPICSSTLGDNPTATSKESPLPSVPLINEKKSILKKKSSSCVPLPPNSSSPRPNNPTSPTRSLRSPKKKRSQSFSPSPQRKPQTAPTCEKTCSLPKSPERNSPTASSKSSRSLQDFLPCLKKLSSLIQQRKNPPKKVSPKISPTKNSSSFKTPEIKTKLPERPSCNACKKTDSENFPWPLQNKHSNQPSATSLCPELLLSPSESESDKNSDLKKLFCTKKPYGCTSPKCNSPRKLSGIFLKMKPSNKVNLKQSSSKSKKKKTKAPLGIKCSEDKIIIRIKKETPSTEEIREGMNIKVEDEDGITLFERKDYVYKPTDEKQKIPSVLDDVYKNSQVHVLSTSRVDAIVGIDKDSNTNLTDVKSDRSVANLIEINFKLNVTQGEKTAEINMGNKKLDTKNHIGQTSQEVFLLKDEAEQCTEDTTDKNDINIKIIIKNFKQRDVNKPCTEDFAHKITEKFQTVSTCYSDVLPEKPTDVFSIHKVTVDLASSNEISETDITDKDVPGLKCVENDLTDIGSQSATGKTYTVKSETNLELPDTTNRTVEDMQHYIYKEDDNFIVNTENYSSMTDTDDDDIKMTSNGPLISNSVDLITKALTRDEKKSLLKKVFEKASKIKKYGNKKKLKPIKDMLKVILTDSSDQEIKTSRDIVNEMTYSSKPNYFRETDSMNNYYKTESSSATCVNKENNLIFPSETVSHNVSEESFEVDDGETDCMCSTLAAKLNMCGSACCCNRKVKAVKETNCDLRIEEDYALLNYKRIKHKDVDTQHFGCRDSEIASVQSRGVSVSSLKKYVKVTNEDVSDRCVKELVPNPGSASRKRSDYKHLNKYSMLGVTADDKILLLHSKPNVSVNKVSINTRRSCEKVEKRVFTKCESPADILQSYETKKAVLEIYAEKVIEHNKEKIVARLPKILYDDASSDDEDYEAVATDINQGLTNNVVLMS